MHRPTVGILALGLLALGALLSFLTSGAESQAWAAGLLRVGIAAAALWLALPELKRLPRWILISAAVLLLVLARWPRQFFVAVIVVVAFALLRPRVKTNRRDP